jgi:hypothetical protein
MAIITKKLIPLRGYEIRADGVAVGFAAPPWKTGSLRFDFTPNDLGRKRGLNPFGCRSMKDGREVGVLTTVAHAIKPLDEVVEQVEIIPRLLDDVITLGGRALEAEDRQLREIGQRRGRHGGLLRTEYERYYQFIVWKSLLDKYNADVEYNHGGYLVDLVIVHDGTPHIFEMKNWREETTTKVYSDIVRLQSFARGGFLLVFSNNPKHLTDENIESITTLRGIGGSVSCYRFPTENAKGDASYEFWFAGWPVPSEIRAIES